MPLDNPATIPAQESWIAPTLLNGWQNYGSILNSAGYWKDSYGVVHLRGVVKSGTAGTIIFVLPSGYRPTARELFPSLSGDSGGNTVLGRVDISSLGEIYHYGGGTAFLTLDGMSFRAV